VIKESHAFPQGKTMSNDGSKNSAAFPVPRSASSQASSQENSDKPILYPAKYDIPSSRGRARDLGTSRYRYLVLEVRKSIQDLRYVDEGRYDRYLSHLTPFHFCLEQN